MAPLPDPLKPTLPSEPSIGFDPGGPTLPPQTGWGSTLPTSPTLPKLDFSIPPPPPLPSNALIGTGLQGGGNLKLGKDTGPALSWGGSVSSYPLAAHGKLIGTPYSGTHTLGNWESDNAVDIGVPKGTPVYAVVSGRIGSQFGPLAEGATNSRFAGLRLHLAGDGNEFYYAHLSAFAPGIQPGKYVKAGTLLGYSGVANGVQHLHISSEYGNIMKILGFA